MGYTHYWNRPGDVPLNEKEFEKFTEVCHKIINSCKADSPIGGVYYQDEIVEIVGPEGTAADKVRITGKQVAFNGLGDNAFEGFVISNHKDKAILDTFSFCKTNQKPYDIVVMACLIAFKRFFTDTCSISSDGGIMEWESGLELYNANVTDSNKVSSEVLVKWLES